MQKYTEELHKKGPNDLDKDNGVVTHQSRASWTVKSSDLIKHYYE